MRADSRLDLLLCFNLSPFEESLNPYIKQRPSRSEGPHWGDFWNSRDFGVRQARSDLGRFNLTKPPFYKRGAFAWLQGQWQRLNEIM